MMKPFIVLSLGVLQLVTAGLSFANDARPCFHDKECTKEVVCTVIFKDPSGVEKSITRNHIIYRDELGLFATIDDSGMFDNYLSTNIQQESITGDEVRKDETLPELAKLAKVKLVKVASAQTYVIDASSDGAPASIAVFKDSKGKVLGQAGVFGWFAAKCE